jgi:nickel/cobalt transporter (NiCoT) family protein
MNHILSNLFGKQAADIRGRVIGIYALLIAANIAAWIWALISFRHFPLLLGTSLLAYSFGLRHAVDADHIAAIDNVTRKLMNEGKRPVAVGLFFSLGHSTIVVLATAGIATAVITFKPELEDLHRFGAAISTLISASFLLLIAGMNLMILRGVWQAFRRVREDGCFVEEDLDMLLAQGGFFARIFRPMFRMIGHSWQMYLLGVLFGLGFDTATEVSLLGISAAEASHGLPIWSILVFPALFTAGMSLIDTLDGTLMLGAYGWAFLKPIRKLYYNMTITAVSVIVALAVGGIEVLGLIGDQFNLGGPFWDAVGNLNENFGVVGYAIIALFVGAWIVSLAIYRFKGYDDIEVDAASPTG